MPKKLIKLSIVIPIFNEKNTIEKVIRDVIKSIPFHLDYEIIIVDNNSTDGTKKLLRNFSKNNEIKLLENHNNLGKGASLKKGFIKTSGDIVIIQDADLEYSPNDYPNLIRPIFEGYADVVYGSRFLNSNPHRVLYFYHYLANTAITTLSNLFTNLNLSDIETGYKVFRGDLIRKIAPKLKSKKFGFEPEITARIAKIRNVKVYEVGISYFGRTYDEGKKITWVDGLLAIFQIIKYNLFD